MSAKGQALRDLLSSCHAVVVAYSGGVDSAYLTSVAHEVLGRAALAVTADSPSYPDRHRRIAREMAVRFGWSHQVIRTDELDRADYSANPSNRCYFCKHELYTHLSALGRERGAVVVDGNNADDRGDYRPGRQAAAEFGVRSPLDEVGLGKAEIRALARDAGLPIWDEPASACLSSRIPYNDPVTIEKLRVIERAEEGVRALGYRVVRVRHHDQLARVELGAEELSRAAEPSALAAIVRVLTALGYREVVLDPRGYRTGSLNEGLVLRPV